MEFLKNLMIDDNWVTTGIIYGVLIIAIVLLLKNLAKVSGFVGEVKGELRKASWPWDQDPKAKGFKKYKELIDSTIVVLIAVILLAGFVQFWDLVQILIVGFLSEIFR